MTLKYLKIGKYELYAAAIIAFATGLRILLIALNWPPTNSDEGVMGIIAIHVAYHGEHPLVFYGQDYMGTSEAYLAALFFHLFGGPSLFALRLGVVLMIMFFFITMYFLCSLIFSKKLALVTLALLSVGSIAYMTRQTLATGGSAETLLFGSLSFLLAAWLSLTYQRRIPPRLKLLRCAAYFALGLVVGLAIWSDMVAAPVIAFAGLLLLVFCWRDLMPWGLPTVVPGILIGLLPSLRYSMLHNLNPISTLLSLFHGLDAHPPTTLLGILNDVKETIVVSIPTATGNPFCPVQELSFLSDNTPRTAACEAIRGGWGTGYLVLLGLALVLTIIALWRMRSRFRSEPELSSVEKQELAVRSTTRLMMLGAAALTIVAFAISAAPVWWPAFHARYFITLLILLPAVIEPVWNAASKVNVQRASERVKMIVSRGIFVISATALLIGTFLLFSEIPAAQSSTQNYVSLDNKLVSLGVQNAKSDYWSCYNITFLSGERIKCDVMTDGLKPGYNRPPHYNETILADPHAAYVINAATEMPALMRLIHEGKGKVYKFNGYTVYIP